MRAVECPCGEALEARNDIELMQRMKQHTDAEHPGEYDEATLRSLIATSAYDAGRVEDEART